MSVRCGILGGNVPKIAMRVPVQIFASRNAVRGQVLQYGWRGDHLPEREKRRRRKLWNGWLSLLLLHDGLLEREAAREHAWQNAKAGTLALKRKSGDLRLAGRRGHECDGVTIMTERLAVEQVAFNFAQASGFCK